MSTSTRLGAPAGTSGAGSVAPARVSMVAALATPVRCRPDTFWKAMTASAVSAP
jgi:hypothetical protein